MKSEKLVEILKFKITIFMTIIAASFYVAVNLNKLPIPIEYGIIISMLLVIYGVFGFVVNMLKLSKIQKEFE